MQGQQRMCTSCFNQECGMRMHVLGQRWAQCEKNIYIADKQGCIAVAVVACDSHLGQHCPAWHMQLPCHQAQRAKRAQAHAAGPRVLPQLHWASCIADALGQAQAPLCRPSKDWPESAWGTAGVANARCCPMFTSSANDLRSMASTMHHTVERTGFSTGPNTSTAGKAHACCCPVTSRKPTGRYA
jgi:hypothetical protein